MRELDMSDELRNAHNSSAAAYESPMTSFDTRNRYDTERAQDASAKSSNKISMRIVEPASSVQSVKGQFGDSKTGDAYPSCDLITEQAKSTMDKTQTRTHISKFGHNKQSVQEEIDSIY